MSSALGSVRSVSRNVKLKSLLDAVLVGDLQTMYTDQKEPGAFTLSLPHASIIIEEVTG